MHLEATLQRCGTATQRRECEHTVNKVVSMQGEVIKMLLSHAFFFWDIFPRCPQSEEEERTKIPAHIASKTYFAIKLFSQLISSSSPPRQSPSAAPPSRNTTNASPLMCFVPNAKSHD